MKRLFISLAILAGISLSSCNDSFLEKTPVTDLTENNAFNSYDNFKAFMWPCYEMFTNNTIRTSLQGFGQDGQYKGDMAAGYFQQNLKAHGVHPPAYVVYLLVYPRRGQNATARFAQNPAPKTGKFAGGENAKRPFLPGHGRV